jgi:APA family basic amino acid/polyamine antiporter
VPGHPWTTLLFVAACAVIVAATLYNNPVNSLIGFAILAAGVPACLYWQSRARS